MKELSYTDDLIVWNLRTENQVSAADIEKFSLFIEALTEQGFPYWSIGEDDYPLEPGNTGLVLIVNHSDERQWREFLLATGSVTFRMITPEVGHATWTITELASIVRLRQFLMDLHTSYELISAAVSSNAP